MTREASTHSATQDSSATAPAARAPRDLGDRMRLSRRGWLQAAGVGLALPWLDCVQGRAAAARHGQSPPRMMFICSSLGFHGPNVFPAEEGSDYQAPPYLQILQEHRDQFTIYSGLSHPDQAGANGHSSEMTWLTSAPHPGLSGFRNTISVDQLAVEKLGFVTRFPSLVLGVASSSQSYTRSGVQIPAMDRPSVIFSELFLDGSEQEKQRQRRKLREGRSILDAVAAEARRLEKQATAADRHRLDEYFQSVREMEQRLAEAEAWSRTPKPPVDAEPPSDIQNAADLIGRLELLFELIPLALQTDSTRIITLLIQGRNDVPPVPGVSLDHHNLSHHGQDPEKIAQLELIEQAEFRAFHKLLTSLRNKQEGASNLLQQTAIVFGSNLGNANSHDWRNLPILLAGGGYRHGRHIRFNSEANRPLSDLFVALLQRQGLEVDQFGSSRGALELG